MIAIKSKDLFFTKESGLELGLTTSLLWSSGVWVCSWVFWCFRLIHLWVCFSLTVCFTHCAVAWQ